MLRIIVNHQLYASVKHVSTLNLDPIPIRQLQKVNSCSTRLERRQHALQDRKIRAGKQSLKISSSSGSRKQLSIFPRE
ncbi:hypothetical protein CEXT_345641 [Caerostris extrusa]|uniref:Uncharacterized protein n=1 Tax=Caerostris extrusa TaxID=172846 RepID=A0AAV4PS67_CAEEX|nr:hypothetical protein CEXT_345641 [Caerostris extrusa]